MTQTNPGSRAFDSTRIQPGWNVYAADGDKLGEISYVTPSFLALAQSADFPHERQVPTSAVTNSEHGRVYLNLTRAEIDSRFTDVRSEVSPSAERRGPTEQTGEPGVGATRTIELQEERLEPRKELQETGRVRFRKEVETVPRRLEAEAYREEVTIEHVPIGRVVNERTSAREEQGVFVIPVYEEQLVVVKRLILKEEIRIRREGATERRLFEETVRRERLVVDDPQGTGRVRERYPTEHPDGDRVAGDTLSREEAEPQQTGFLDRLGRKVLE